MKRKRSTIGELNQRIHDRERENPHVYDEVDPDDHNESELVRAYVEALEVDRQQGLPWSEEDREFLISFALDYVPPGRAGRPHDPQRTRALAAAIAYGKAHHKQIKANCLTAEDAWERTATEMRRRYSDLFGGKSTKTIRDTLSRRQYRK